MNQPNRIIKIVVLTSSGLLAAVFILYRAGVFDSPSDVVPAVVAADSISTSLAADSAGAIDHTAAPLVDAAYVPDTPSTTTTTTTTAPKNSTTRKDTVRRSRFLGGSKSGVPMIDVSTSDKPLSRGDTIEIISDTAPPRREVFMGGSKSLAPMIETRTPQQEQGTVRDSTKKKPNKR